MRPLIPDPLEHRHQPVVDDVLEGAEREAGIEHRRRRRAVEALGGADECLRVLRLDPGAGRALGRGAAVAAALAGVARGEPVECLGGGLPRRPAFVDKGIHDRERPHVVRSVEPVAAVGALRADDAVAALPGAERRDADAGQLGGSLDGVHGGPSPPRPSRPRASRIPASASSPSFFSAGASKGATNFATPLNSKAAW